MSPPANATFRGYANAAAVGILLAAAIKFIPITLTEIEFLSSALVSDYLIQPSGSGPNFPLWSVFLQAIIQSFGVILILLLYLHGNTSRIVQEPERLSKPDKSFNLLTHRHKWLALPPEDQMDRVGIIIVTAGLFCYNLWLGTNQAPPGLDQVQGVIGSVLLILFGAALGLAILGLLSAWPRQWRWLAGISFLLGLAVLLGIIRPLGGVVLRSAPLLLVLGVVCQVYGMGRLLRILQGQIGLKWRTTFTVAIATTVVYFGDRFISRLI